MPGTPQAAAPMAEHRAQFVGIYEHGLDDKGRMVLPSKMRAHLGESGYLAMLDRCLGLWTQEGFAEVADGMRERMSAGELPMDSFRLFTAYAAEVSPDGQGRIVVPPVLRDYAGLGREAVVVGALNRAEIWDKGRWDELSSTQNERLAEAVAALRI